MNNGSANVNLSKTQLPKIIQSDGFLGRLLSSLLKTGLPLIENLLKPLATSVFHTIRIITSSISSRRSK